MSIYEELMKEFEALKKELKELIKELEELEKLYFQKKQEEVNKK